MAKHTAPATTSAVTSDRPAQCIDIPLDAVVPDPNNRPIDESSERFLQLVDSIRLFGVINRAHVRAVGDGTYQLIDGERRWRAARAAGRSTFPVEAWPADTNVADLLARGIVSNDQRDDHGAVHIARRMRELKLEHGHTLEQLAQRLCMPHSRVKLYSSLFQGSEELLRFFEDHAIPLQLAAEFVKYEKATNEIAARKLAQRHLKEPLSCEQIAHLRSKLRSEDRLEVVDDPKPERRRTFVRQLESAFRRDPAAARAELESALAALGFRLVPVALPDGAGKESVS
jgi:ParB family chromosome partitioning protein